MKINLEKTESKIKKRFIKDFSLPIPVFEDEYFNYFCDLYNEYFGIFEKIGYLNECINNINEDFFVYYNKLRDQIINTIKDLDIYQEFNSFEMKKYDKKFSDCIIQIKNKELYTTENVGKKFYSIDLKKANYHAMKWYSEDLILNSESYEDMISNFTDFEYFKKSKYFRQVLFGNLNPKRQQSIQQYMMKQILNKLLTNNNNLNIFSVSRDEIVIELEHESFINEIPESTKKIEQSFYNIPYFDKLHINKFILNSVEDKFFVKCFNNNGNLQTMDGYELKCVPDLLFAQVYKKFNNLELHENDLLFYYEKQLAKFINPLFRD